MHKNNFVVAVKANSQILREQGEQILLPFGTEYSILLKNLNTTKSLVTIEIDGRSIGKQLIINPHSSLELERFVEDLQQGSRFKFIEKSDKIKQHRGDKVDDGIIRVEFQFEEQVKFQDYIYPSTTWISYPTYIDTLQVPNNYEVTWTCEDNLSDIKTYDNYFNQVNNKELSYQVSNCALDGITTKGSISDQKFQYDNIGTLESQKYVISLQLRGTKETGKQVTEPLTVKEKLVCEICGTSNKSSHKFCCECGTYLD